MELSFEEVDKSVLILRADGGLNAETSAQFVADLETLVDDGLRKIIVDCEHLEYISGYAMTVLLRLHSKLKSHGGDVKFALVKSTLAEMLAAVHLSEYFDIYPDVSQARLAFRPIN